MRPSTNTWLFLGFAIAFAVKAPLFPFHGWLPDAYRESSPEVAGLLSGVISKVAAYGFLRIAIAKFPEPAEDLQTPILVLAVDRARLRLAARVPRARHPRRGRVLVARADGADHVRPVRRQRPGLQRRGAADGQPRADLDALFLLAGMVERRTATGELSLLGGMARGRPALATVLMTRA